MSCLFLSFKAAAVVTYNVWKEWDRDQKLKVIMRDYLEVFWEIMRDPRWKNDFNLAFRAVFDDPGNRMIGVIGPPCSTLHWFKNTGGPGCTAGGQRPGPAR